MKRILILILILIISVPFLPNIATPAYADTIRLTAQTAILMDAQTGEILYKKNADKKMYPASTTKIMTAILVLENCKLTDKVIIDKESPYTEGSSIYIRTGEEFTVEQLLYALMLESANDTAVALAKHTSGSVKEFAALMNKRAKELGATNTHFTNPNGLPDTNHVTTAYDLAVIAKHGMTIPKFRELVGTARHQIPPTNKVDETRYLKNSNRFLWGTGSDNKIDYKGKTIDIKYDAVEGIKTGYTTVAGNCMVSSAVKDGRRVIAVVMKTVGKNLYVDSRTLLDYGLANLKPTAKAAVAQHTAKSDDSGAKPPLAKWDERTVEKLAALESQVEIAADYEAVGGYVEEVAYAENALVSEDTVQSLEAMLADLKISPSYANIGIAIVLFLLFRAAASGRSRRRSDGRRRRV